MSKTLLFLLLFSSCVVNAQIIRQPITSFSPRDYGLSYYTYCVAEDSYGLIYVGTSYGILQYDGNSWRFIPVKAGANVNSLIVINDTIYVGTHNDFGYLKANKTGKYEYHSIFEESQQNEIIFSSVWNILPWNNNIVFQADEAIFIYNGQELRVFESLTSYHMIYVNDGELYARERHIGLQRFDGNMFADVPHGHLFAETRVLCMLPTSDASTLLATREDGLWKWDNEEFSKITLDGDFENFLIESSVYGAILLNDGNYALFTLQNGIIILNSDYELLVNYNIDTGLSTSEIIDLIQDSYGNLWAATLTGPNRIQYTSPFSTFSNTVGLYGTVQAVAKVDNDFLVGTIDNLYITDIYGHRLFKEVERVNSGAWAFNETPAGLYIASSSGVWLYNKKFFHRISQIEAFAMTYVEENNWIVAAGNRGVQIIDASSKEVLLLINQIRADNAYGLAYTYDTETSNCQIWIGSRIKGVWQLTIDNSLRYKYNYYEGIEDGLDDGWICPYKAGNKVIFATTKGCYRFISPEEMAKALNDSTIDHSDLRGYFDVNSFPKHSLDKAITAFYFHDSTSYAGLDYLVNAINMYDSIPDSYHFKSLQLGRINVLNKKDDVLMVGGDNGLSIANLDIIRNKEYIPPKLMLRRIFIGNDSLIWEGDIPQYRKTIIVPFTYNSLLIELASTYFDNEFTALFSYKMGGQEHSYGRWTSQNFIPLANLREGRYEFVFAAKSTRGELSNEITLIVQILPPWYRSIWAYTSYIIALIALVILTIHLNTRRLKAKTRKLERIVKERTKEIVEQKEYIEYQKTRIEDSIRYAQRIQSALLPTDSYIAELFDDYFILFKPKDVVSGDFYYATTIDDMIVVVAADCTGHGVPGAFMSMLGISFLNQITAKRNYNNAAEILQKLRNAVIKSLKQTLDEDSQVDGMDLSLAVINKKTLMCHWAGAFNPLWIIRNESINKPYDNPDDVIEEIKADKMPVAIFVRLDNFTNHEIQLHKGDRLYMFSDGYVDQFGGLKKKKYNKRDFKKTIVETAHLSMKEQGEILEKTINDWLNPTEDLNYDQIDDIVVFGIKM